MTLWLLRTYEQNVRVPEERRLQLVEVSGCELPFVAGQRLHKQLPDPADIAREDDAFSVGGPGGKFFDARCERELFPAGGRAAPLRTVWDGETRKRSSRKC